MLRPLNAVGWTRCVEALAEVIATSTRLHNLKRVDGIREADLVLGDQCVTQLAGQLRPLVYESVHGPMVHQEPSAVPSIALICRDPRS